MTPAHFNQLDNTSHKEPLSLPTNNSLSDVKVSVRTKMVAVIVPLLVMINLVAGAIFGLSAQREQSHVLDMRATQILKIQSQAIGPHLWNFRTDEIAEILKSLTEDPDIAFAQVLDKSGKLTAEHISPYRHKQIKQRAHPIGLKTNFVDETIGQLAIGFSLDRADAAFWNALRTGVQSSAVLSLALMLIILVANKFVIGRPLNLMIDAIVETKESGQSKPIIWAKQDEFGYVASAFNEMQTTLASRADKISKSLIELEHIYNNTPAMLFSITTEGEITHVSDNLVEMTGFLKEDLRGRHVRTLLTRAGGALFESELKAKLKVGKKLKSIELRIRRSGKKKLDVLFSASPEVNSDGSVGNVLCVVTDVTELRRVEQELQHRALTDVLSGLPNRYGFEQRVGHFMTGSVKHDGHAAVFFIDLDNFKLINDTYGHQAGDDLIVGAATRLKNTIRTNDFVARLGGDEFALLCYGLSDASEAEQLAKRLLDRISRPFDLSGVEGFVTASIGISIYKPGLSAQEMLRQADLAMYESKKMGRNQFHIFSSDLSKQAESRIRIEQQIRDGLSTNSFKLFLQPIVSLSNLKPVGAEALLRLSLPGQPAISPGEFIPVAEETGQITELGSWVVRDGIKQLRELHNRGASKLYVTINLSAKQLNAELVESIEAELADQPEIAQCLVLEMTETTWLQQTEMVLDTLQKLRSLGCRIALDDFGTGFSSLSYIHRFPVDIIKLDRSFICGLGTTSNDRRVSLVKATVTLCSELEIALVAEGIETDAELEFLKSLNVELGQGYLFSPPLPSKEFETWLAAFGRPSLQLDNNEFNGGGRGEVISITGPANTKRLSSNT